MIIDDVDNKEIFLTNIIDALYKKLSENDIILSVNDYKNVIENIENVLPGNGVIDNKVAFNIIPAKKDANTILEIDVQIPSISYNKKLYTAIKDNKVLKFDNKIIFEYLDIAKYINTQNQIHATEYENIYKLLKDFMSGTSSIPHIDVIHKIKDFISELNNHYNKTHATNLNIDAVYLKSIILNKKNIKIIEESAYLNRADFKEDKKTNFVFIYYDGKNLPDYNLYRGTLILATNDLFEKVYPDKITSTISQYISENNSINYMTSILPSTLERKDLIELLKDCKCGIHSKNSIRDLNEKLKIEMLNYRTALLTGASFEKKYPQFSNELYKRLNTCYFCERIEDSEIQIFQGIEKRKLIEEIDSINNIVPLTSNSLRHILVDFNVQKRVSEIFLTKITEEQTFFQEDKKDIERLFNFYISNEATYNLDKPPHDVCNINISNKLLEALQEMYISSLFPKSQIIDFVSNSNILTNIYTILTKEYDVKKINQINSFDKIIFDILKIYPNEINSKDIKNVIDDTLNSSIKANLSQNNTYIFDAVFCDEDFEEINNMGELSLSNQEQEKDAI